MADDLTRKVKGNPAPSSGAAVVREETPGRSSRRDT